MIEAQGLMKRYGPRLALSGVTLEAGPGEILGLIGPNGAGKTTTIRILASLIRPDAGSARIAGFDVTHEVERVRGVVGYMPELFGLYDELTLEQYLDFFARVYGFRGRERRRQIEGVLELVDLRSKRRDRCDGLSKGVRQRLFLARTLLFDPQVLLLDEPASGLDPQARIDLRLLLGLLRQQGKTILVSSHILSELEQLCTRVVVIEGGRVRYAGAIQEVTGRVSCEQRIRIRLLDPEGAARAAALLEPVEAPPLSSEPDSEPLASTAEASPSAAAAAPDGVVTGIRIERDEVHVELAGDRSAVASLHRRLVEAGVPVFSFEVQTPNLEALFLDVTRGEVA